MPRQPLHPFRSRRRLRPLPPRPPGEPYRPPSRLAKYLLIGIVVLFVVVGIAVALNSKNSTSVSSETSQPSVATQEMPAEVSPEGVMLDVARTNPVLTTFTWSTSECSGVTTTPLVIDDRLIYSLHDKTLGVSCEDQSVSLDSLMSYSIEDQEIQPLFMLSEAEGTALYVPEEEQLFVPLLRQNRPYAIVDTSGPRWKEVMAPPSIASIVDSAAVYLDGYYYVGTVNLPMPICQNPFSEDCGAMFKIDAQTGRVVDRLNAEDGFRGWITGAPTTDGEYVYVGTGAGMWGETTPIDTYACSVVKLTQDLEVVASVDLGEAGCPSFEGSGEEQGVAGEIVQSRDGVWVQYTRPSGEDEPAVIVHYDHDLQEICRVEQPTIPPASNAGYYQAPVIDGDGNAYVSWRFIAQYIEQTGLYRITPDCETTQLISFSEPFVGSPTLADDQYLLAMNGNTLVIIDKKTGELYHQIELETEVDAMTAPVVHKGVIYVLSTDGTISSIHSSGVWGYGDAIWPRLRKDNWGTARLD